MAAVLLLGIMGLAIDSGYLQFTRRCMQSAADAAAIAAALEIQVQSGQQIEAARADAALNGFKDGVNRVSVRVFIKPEGNVEAAVSQAVSPLIMSAFGFREVDLEMRAQAHLVAGKAVLGP